MEIKNQDCFKFLENNNQEIDLILTDPPYAISRSTGFSAVKNGEKRFAVSMDFGEWDQDEIDLERFCKLAYNNLKKHGTAIIFYDLWKVTKLADAMKKAGFVQLRFIEWLKTNPVPLNSKINYLTNSREIAIVGVKVSKPTFHGEYHNGIFKYPIPNGRKEDKRLHPTQKPLKLFEELMNLHSNEGDLVCDPFLGSGTTAVASLRHERNFIGCEKNKLYYTSALNRIIGEENDYKESTLFRTSQS